MGKNNPTKTDDYEVDFLDSLPSATNAECYDLNNDITPQEYCFFQNNANKSACESAFNTEIECSAGTACNTSATLGNYQHILDTSVKGTYPVDGWFYDCVSPTERDSAGNELTAYVVDMKRVRCTNSSAFVVEGRYTANSWVQIGNYGTI